jgi:hypothetical protein
MGLSYPKRAEIYIFLSLLFGLASNTVLLFVAGMYSILQIYTGTIYHIFVIILKWIGNHIYILRK